MEKKAANVLSIDRDQVLMAVKAIKCYDKKKAEVKKTLALSDTDEVVHIQFSFKKTPKLDRKNIKVQLPHPSFSPDSSTVCMFVKDLVQSREYQKTVNKYKEIFASCGVKQDIEFVPMKRLKLEFTDFEAKKNLANSYDVFLADVRIIRLLPAILGKSFIARHRFPLQVRLDAKDLSTEIEQALSTSQCILSGKGSTCQMSVGLLSQADPHLVDNISECMKVLAEQIPGGAVNIRNIVVKTASSKALPIYLSLGSKEEVTLPKQTRKREVIKAEEVTTVLRGKVSVSTARNTVRVKVPGPKRAKVNNIISKDSD